MADLTQGNTPNSLMEHFDAIWELLLAVCGVILGIVLTVGRSYRNRFAKLEAHQIKLRRMIPHEAYEKEAILMTCDSCEFYRGRCQNVAMVKELEDTLKVVKQALVVLVMHNDTIPANDKERIAKDLVSD